MQQRKNSKSSTNSAAEASKPAGTSPAAAPTQTTPAAGAATAAAPMATVAAAAAAAAAALEKQQVSKGTTSSAPAPKKTKAEKRAEAKAAKKGKGADKGKSTNSQAAAAPVVDKEAENRQLYMTLAEAYMSRGKTDFEMGAFPAALNAWQQAAQYFNQADHNNVRIYNNLVMACLKLEKFEEAEAHAQEALQRTKGSSDSELRAKVHFRLGQALEARGKPVAAAEAFVKARELDPAAVSTSTVAAKRSAASEALRAGAAPRAAEQAGSSTARAAASGSSLAPEASSAPPLKADNSTSQAAPSTAASKHAARPGVRSTLISELPMHEERSASGATVKHFTVQAAHGAAAPDAAAAEASRRTRQASSAGKLQVSVLPLTLLGQAFACIAAWLCVYCWSCHDCCTRHCSS